LIAGLGFLVAGVLLSARPGDRLRDIPSVFMRRPLVFIWAAMTFVVAWVLLRAALG
jgi:hypothetical protein